MGINTVLIAAIAWGAFVMLTLGILLSVVARRKRQKSSSHHSPSVGHSTGCLSDNPAYGLPYSHSNMPASVPKMCYNQDLEYDYATSDVMVNPAHGINCRLQQLDNPAANMTDNESTDSLSDNPGYGLHVPDVQESMAISASKMCDKQDQAHLYDYATSKVMVDPADRINHRLHQPDNPGSGMTKNDAYGLYTADNPEYDYIASQGHAKHTKRSN